MAVRTGGRPGSQQAVLEQASGPQRALRRRQDLVPGPALRPNMPQPCWAEKCASGFNNQPWGSVIWWLFFLSKLIL